MLVMVQSHGLTLLNNLKAPTLTGWGPPYSQESYDMTTKDIIDDTMLNSMLAQSQYAQAEEEFWFSRANQKKMVFDLGAKLLVSEDITAREAVSMAQDYIDTFYATTLSPQGWKKD